MAGDTSGRYQPVQFMENKIPRVYSGTGEDHPITHQDIINRYGASFVNSSWNTVDNFKYVIRYYIEVRSQGDIKNPDSKQTVIVDVDCIVHGGTGTDPFLQRRILVYKDNELIDRKTMEKFKAVNYDEIKTAVVKFLSGI